MLYIFQYLCHYSPVRYNSKRAYLLWRGDLTHEIRALLIQALWKHHCKDRIWLVLCCYLLLNVCLSGVENKMNSLFPLKIPRWLKDLSLGNWYFKAFILPYYKTEEVETCAYLWVSNVVSSTFFPQGVNNMYNTIGCWKIWVQNIVQLPWHILVSKWFGVSLGNIARLFSCICSRDHNRSV